MLRAPTNRFRDSEIPSLYRHGAGSACAGMAIFWRDRSEMMVRGGLKARGFSVEKSNLISGMIWLILAVLISVSSIRLGLGEYRVPGPGFFPFLTALPLGLLSIYLIATSILSDAGKKRKIAWPINRNGMKIVLTVASLIAYSFFLERIGYLLITFLLMLFLFKNIEPQKWRIALLGSFLSVALSYIVFNVWLEVQWPAGIIEQWIR